LNRKLFSKRNIKKSWSMFWNNVCNNWWFSTE